MAIFKSKTPTAAPEPFHVPSFSEVSETYSTLLARQRELEAEQLTLKKERKDIEDKLSADRGSDFSAAAAALLGDDGPANTRHEYRARIKELSERQRLVGAAIELARDRLKAESVTASHEICHRVEPEFNRRVAAVRDAAKALADARRAYDDLRYQLEMEDVQWTGLGPLTLGFLRDPRDGYLVKLGNANA